MKDIEFVLAHDSANTTAYYLRGLLRGSNHDQEAAITDFNKVLSHDPRQPGAYHYRSLAKMQTGDAAGALQDAEMALKLLPEDPVFLFSLGMLLAKSGKLDSAILVTELALKARPENFKFRQSLGNYKLAQGDLKKAGEIYKSLSEISHNSAITLIGLAIINSMNGNAGLAQTYFVKAVNTEKNLKNGMDEVHKMEKSGVYFSDNMKQVIEELFSEYQKQTD